MAKISIPVGSGVPAMPSTTRDAPMHARELGVVRRQRLERLREVRVAGRHVLEPVLGRAAVRLGHQDVEPDRGRVRARDLAHQLREHGARPRPLAERDDALLVDLDDGRRQGLDRARQQALARVEPLELLAPDERRLQRQQERERGEHAKADPAHRAHAPEHPFGVLFRRFFRGPFRVRGRRHRSISIPS